MDTTKALRQVQEARSRLAEVLADLTVCKLDHDTLTTSSARTSLLPGPAPTAVREALGALDLAAAELGAIEVAPLASVVDLAPAPEPQLGRIPAQRQPVLSA